jgi:hypothetical protein
VIYPVINESIQINRSLYNSDLNNSSKDSPNTNIMIKVAKFTAEITIPIHIQSLAILGWVGFNIKYATAPPIK